MPTRLCQISTVLIVALLALLLSGRTVLAAAVEPHPGRHFEKVTIDRLARSFIVHVPPTWMAIAKCRP
jgi:hypothetical protein